MNKGIVYLILLLLPAVAFAQGRRAKVESSFRLVAGYNSANITIEDNGNVDEANKLNSFHAGVICDLPISPGLSFQGGLIYTGKGSKTALGMEGDPEYFKATTNPMYLEMPLNFVGKIPIKIARLLIGAGAYGAIAVTGKNKTETGIEEGIVIYGNRDIVFQRNSTTNTTIGGYPQMKRFDYGLNALAGFELNRFTLTGTYGYGLSKIVPGTDDNANDKGKHRVLLFSLGLKI